MKRLLSLLVFLVACGTPHDAVVQGAAPLAAVKTVRVYPPAPQTWTVATDWESEALIAQEAYQKACTTYTESVLNALSSKVIAANRAAVVKAQAAYIAAVKTDPLDPPVAPDATTGWAMPLDRNFLTAKEYDYVTACVDFTEDMNTFYDGKTIVDGDDALVSLTASWEDVVKSRCALAGTTPPATIPPLGAVPQPPKPIPIVTTNVLVAGTGAQLNPDPVLVSTKTIPAWDGVSRAPAGIQYGDSALLFNLWDNFPQNGATISGPIPEYVEMSLDGGPWLGTRGTITLPDVPDGLHQVRAVSFPQLPIDAKSKPWQPILLMKTTTDGKAVWHWQ